MKSADDWGKEAFSKIIVNNFSAAVTIFSKAITLYPDDPRFYINRCLCNMKLKDYSGAFKDATFLTDKYPKNCKGYVFKAEIASAQGEFDDAEKYLKDALSHDKSYGVQKLLFKCQVQQLLKFGFQEVLVKKALRGFGSVEEALQALCEQLVSVTAADKNEYLMPITEEEELYLKEALKDFDDGSYADTASYAGSISSYYEDEEDFFWNDSDFTRAPRASRPQSAQDQPIPLRVNRNTPREFLDPANPLKRRNLYVGNVSASVNKKEFEAHFAKYGKIESISYLLEKRSAFVNYHEHQSASKALVNMQGAYFNNMQVHVRYSNYFK